MVETFSETLIYSQCMSVYPNLEKHIFMYTGNFMTGSEKLSYDNMTEHFFFWRHSNRCSSRQQIMHEIIDNLIHICAFVRNYNFLYLSHILFLDFPMTTVTMIVYDWIFYTYHVIISHKAYILYKNAMYFLQSMIS